ncbi:MAG: porphobilinogen synthase [candidate division Zixibacteria bacterium]|nr:porphobilinogen synthase [candidate division Zixibacteria bacterium]MDD5427401.1 porphobilinogen synthase [candidate division Zixibacteria bacterium]
MKFPQSRPRRLRKSAAMRKLVQQTRLHPADFVYPLFVSEQVNNPEPVGSMPGIFNYPLEKIAEEAQKVYECGVPGVLLFGTPRRKDATGSESLKKDGIIQRAVEKIKEINPEILVITDVCLCEYTDHGHCGIVKDGRIDNDATLEVLARQAVSHAKAGADMVAPSDMMDGRVGAIRRALDEYGYTDTAIMPYAAKYNSAFYGPFREAVQSAPRFGDRKTYQMDPANADEALREIALDIDEGADIVMVKPALAYLDIIARARATFNITLAAYNVSGEYTLAKLAGADKWADEKKLIMEILTAIKRAGADIIISYHAPEVARWLQETE